MYTNHAEDTSAQSGLELEACMDLSLACRGTIVFGVFGCDGKMTYETVGHAKAKVRLALHTACTCHSQTCSSGAAREAHRGSLG